MLRQYAKLIHNHSKADITNLPTKVTELDDGANYYTINQLNNKLNSYAKLNHSHTKSEITDFPTKLSEFENDPIKIWESNIFGKSLHELVNEGLQAKLAKMPEDAQMKLQETLERIVNEGSGGLICIIL